MKLCRHPIPTPTMPEIRPFVAENGRSETRSSKVSTRLQVVCVDRDIKV